MNEFLLYEFREHYGWLVRKIEEYGQRLEQEKEGQHFQLTKDDFLDLEFGLENLIKCVKQIELEIVEERMSAFLMDLDPALSKIEIPDNENKSVEVDECEIIPVYLREAHKELHQIHLGIIKEAEYRFFVFIPPPKDDLFERDDLFGKDVSEKFPSAKEEIKAAGNCLAVDLNTAAVYHVIRAAEFALREFVIHLKAKKHLSKPVEECDWGNLIEAVQTKLNQRDAKAKTKPFSESKKRAHKNYRIALNEFRILKDEWRNNVMHTRKPYSYHGAMDVFERVREFLPRLANYLKQQ